MGTTDIVIRTDKKYAVNDDISFGLERFNIYNNGALEGTKNSKDASSSEVFDSQN